MERDTQHKAAYKIMQLRVTFTTQRLFKQAEPELLDDCELQITKQSTRSTLTQHADAAQYCTFRYSNSSRLISCSENALQSCINLVRITTGSVIAPSSIPDETPGLVLNKEREAEASAEISTVRAARARRESAKPSRRREDGQAKRVRAMKKSTTVLSPLKRDDSVNRGGDAIIAGLQ